MFNVVSSIFSSYMTDYAIVCVRTYYISVSLSVGAYDLGRQPVMVVRTPTPINQLF